MERERTTMAHVEEILKKMDVDSNDLITWDEFQQQIGTPETNEFFRTIDVDINHAQDLFDLLNVRGQDTISKSEFMDGCLQIWNPPKGSDLKMLMREINNVKDVVDLVYF